jgi:uncharacterized protein (DUF1499 family)
MQIILGYVSITILFVTVLIWALLFTSIGERPLSAIFTVGDLDRIEFAEFKLKGTPNQFLMCPPEFCDAKPHAKSPVFNVSIDRLHEHWHWIVSHEPRTKLLVEDEEGQQFDYVQRSARFRFPDIITVRFMSVSSWRSTLAIYSRSIYGKGDFGVNRKRIDAWLHSLRETL